MKRYLLIPLLALGFAACNEKAPQKIDGTNLVFVVDSDGTVDLAQISAACNGVENVAHVQYLTKGPGKRRAAVVECR